MPRKQHHNQSFGIDGTLLSETVEDEPLDQYHGRVIRERAEAAIATLTADIVQIDAVDWANVNTAAEIKTLVRGLAANQRDVARAVRGLIRLQLRAFDSMDEAEQ